MLYSDLGKSAHRHRRAQCSGQGRAFQCERKCSCQKRWLAHHEIIVRAWTGAASALQLLWPMHCCMCVQWGCFNTAAFVANGLLHVCAVGLLQHCSFCGQCSVACVCSGAALTRQPCGWIEHWQAWARGGCRVLGWAMKTLAPWTHTSSSGPA
jgi:hypothetical protein